MNFEEWWSEYGHTIGHDGTARKEIARFAWEAALTNTIPVNGDYEMKICERCGTKHLYGLMCPSCYGR